MTQSKLTFNTATHKHDKHVICIIFIAYTFNKAYINEM